jgi:hypothetical protein
MCALALYLVVIRESLKYIGNQCHIVCVLIFRYRGTYLGVDVAIKFLRTDHINDSSKVEFLQEIMILR